MPSFIQIGQLEVGERARTSDRMTDRQTNRQTDRQTHRQTHRQTIQLHLYQQTTSIYNAVWQY